MTVTVSLIGFKKLAKAAKSASRNINKNMSKALLKGALLVFNDAKRAVAGGGKSGRVYKKWNPKRTHTASAPGEAPASDLGKLLASIRFYMADNKLAAYVVATEKYATWLEFGTKDGKIAPRPFMGPAFIKNKPEIIKLIKEAYLESMKQNEEE